MSNDHILLRWGITIIENDEAIIEPFPISTHL